MIYERLNFSNLFPYANLRDALKDNPIRVTGSTMVSLDLVEKTRAAIFYREDSEVFFMYTKRCGILELDIGLPVDDAKLIFKKGNPIVKEVNRVIEENMIEISMIKRKYINVFKVCLGQVRFNNVILRK